MRKKLSIVCILFSVTFILIGFASPFIIKSCIRVEGLKLNEITEWVTSGMSVCFSLSSICLVILNLNISGDNERRSQFQNRFFKLYDIFNSLRKQLPDTYFERIVEGLDNKLIKIDYTVMASDSLRDIAYDTCSCYEEIYKDEKNKLGEYISCLFQLMLFIDSEDIEESEKRFCMNFLGASLSSAEKKIIFYHVVDNYSGKDFHDIVEKYDILWNLDHNSIIEYDRIAWYYKNRIYK